MGLNALLRTLKASGVRHYVADKVRTEVEFWAPSDGESEPRTERPEGEAMHASAKPSYRDPLRVALSDEELGTPPPINGEDPELEAN